MKSALLRLRESKDSLSSTELNIANYILENPRKAGSCTIRELAEQTYASPSSIVRICRAIGFHGYKDFRESLILELAAFGKDMSHKETSIEVGDSMETIIQKITLNNIRSLNDTQHLLNAEILSQCVDLLQNCRTILFFGIGSSLCVAKDTYLKFFRLNKPCIINEDLHSQILMSRNSSANDAAIIFSYSGQTHEMLECMKDLKKNKTPCIAITRYSPSPIAKMADFCLYTAANETLFRNGAMSSRLSQLNIIDILYTAFCSRQQEYTMKQLTKTHIRKETTES